MSNLYRSIPVLLLAATSIFYEGCKLPALTPLPQQKSVPARYSGNTDTSFSGKVSWRNFFGDRYLSNLIDTALRNNPELQITLQEIEIARNDIRVRQGRLLPSVIAGGGAGIEKVGLYTSQGAGDASADITPGQRVPEWLSDLRLGAYASWEVDIWKKLRTEKKAAVTRYLSTIEGRNFVITNLVAEMAGRYYELLALDNQLDVVRRTIGLQKSALEVVRIQKQAARSTELAVKKFEAEVLNSQSLEFDILQKIRETENEINFLAGRYPQPVEREKSNFLDQLPPVVSAGLPSRLLENRADIRQAELDLTAAKLDVKVARAEFYPSFEIGSAIGFNAFKPGYLFRFPESMIFSLAGDLAGPLINKQAIRAEFASANARQLQALYNYERTILNGYVEVSTGLSAIGNFDSLYQLKSRQVDTLTASVDIANDLFRAARADYFEVLMTQRDALDARLELIETKLRQFTAVTRVYRALGGGWN